MMQRRERRVAIIAKNQLIVSRTWNALHANGLFALAVAAVVVAGINISFDLKILDESQPIVCKKRVISYDFGNEGGFRTTELFILIKL